MPEHSEDEIRWASRISDCTFDISSIDWRHITELIRNGESLGRTELETTFRRGIILYCARHSYLEGIRDRVAEVIDDAVKAILEGIPADPARLPSLILEILEVRFSADVDRVFRSVVQGCLGHIAS